MRILITGSHGMLAQHFLKRVLPTSTALLLTDLQSAPPPHHLQAVALGSQGTEFCTLDITDESAVTKVISTFAPEWIVNCAAYTSVDNAETRYDLALAINALGPRTLARAASRVGARLLHISSDYVFGAGRSAERPWRESDPHTPCGIYGYSKALGDDFVQDTLPDHHLILRPSWLHGVYGPNFVHTILRIAREKAEIRVVEDQIGSPTWAEWLAGVMVSLMQRNAQGLFHTSSRGNISWFDFATEIVRQAKLPTKVLPQSSAELGRAAPRPPFSTLDTSKVEEVLGTPCPEWREGITLHLDALSSAIET